MGQESKNLRDLIAGVISGTTINVVNSTTTDLMRAVISTDGLSLKVSGNFGTGGTGTSGTSGHNGSSGTSGSGQAGTSGTSGDSGTSGTSGDPGGSGTSGTSGGGGGSSTYDNENANTPSFTGSTLHTYFRCSGCTDFWLPSAINDGKWYFIKNLTGTMIVHPQYGETIDYQQTKTMNQFDAIQLTELESGNWDII